MSSIAVLSKPYWRWLRWHRKRGSFRRSTTIAKPWNGMIRAAMIVLPLLALDQLTKNILNTPDWGWHSQPTSWIISPLLGCALALPFLRFNHARLPACLFIAGCIGNLTSFLVTNKIANPYVIQRGADTVAFNTADLCLFASVAATAVAGTQFILESRRQP